jgi:hypothetical protein
VVSLPISSPLRSTLPADDPPPSPCMTFTPCEHPGLPDSSCSLRSVGRQAALFSVDACPPDERGRYSAIRVLLIFPSQRSSRLDEPPEGRSPG